MFTFRIYDADGEFVTEAPLRGKTYELHIPRECHVEKGEFVFDGHVLALWTSPSERHLGEGDIFNLKLKHPLETDDDLNLLFAAAMRFSTRRVGALVYGIRQMRDYINGQETGEPIHHFNPQAYKSVGLLQNEEPQPVRSGCCGLLVQWFKERFVG